MPVLETVDKVEAAADVFDGDAVEQYLVGVGIASANEDGGEATALAGLHDVKSGYLAKRVDHDGVVQEVGSC